jgi:hypothetical protein
MAVVDIDTLKSYFNKGDKPTESNYVDLLDTLSQILYNDTKIYTSGESVVINNSGLKHYLCNSTTVAGESPITTPAKWDQVGSGSSTSFKIESSSGDSLAEFGNLGTDEFLTVVSNLLTVAHFGDGATHSRLVLDPNGILGALTGLSWGDGDTRLYELVDDNLAFDIAGVYEVLINNTQITGSSSFNFSIYHSRTSSSVSPIYTFRGDDDTGANRPFADAYSLICGGQEGFRVEEANGEVFVKWNWDTGITASATQTQGEQVLISSRNEIATVANTNDVVTMPPAVEGREVLIRNNGVNTLQIYPSSGDDLGSGVDTSVTLAINTTVVFEAYNSTNWIIK